MAMLSVSMARCRCGDREICAEKTTRPTICSGKPASAQEMHMWITSSQQQARSSGGNAPASTSISTSSFECAPSTNASAHCAARAQLLLPHAHGAAAWSCAALTSEQTRIQPDILFSYIT